jgi:hypothetical protein
LHVALTTGAQDERALPAIVLELIDVLPGALSEHCLMHCLREGNKAKLGTDAFAGVRHFSRSLGFQGGFLELAHMRKPVS